MTLSCQQGFRKLVRMLRGRWTMVHWFVVLSSEVRNPVANKALIIRQKKHCPGLNFRPRAMLSIFITRELSATACRSDRISSGLGYRLRNRWKSTASRKASSDLRSVGRDEFWRTDVQSPCSCQARRNRRGRHRQGRVRSPRT